MVNLLIAIISGVATSVLLFFVAGIVIMKWQVFPFYDFYQALVAGNSEGAFELGKYFDVFLGFVIVPVLSFFSGLVSALIARKREYLIAHVSMLPLLILLFLSFPLVASRLLILVFIGFVFGVLGGARMANTIRKKIAGY